MAQVELDRRTFLVSAAAFAGGMSLSLLLPARARAAESNASQRLEGEVEFSAWLSIAPDDTVTVRVPTGESGTGSMTQVPMNIAEELGCDWSKVRAESASPRRDYLEHGVYSIGNLAFFAGHGTDEDRMKYALQLGASARERLKAAAAARWNVPASELEARNSVITHAPSGRKLRYGEVAAAAAAIQLAAEPALKPQSEWTFLGKATPAKLQLPGMVNGAAVYGMDVKVPGMVHAALLQCPVHGGRLKSHDPSAVLKLPGVRAVVVLDRSKTKGSPVRQQSSFGLEPTATQSAVAVIADHYWQAKKALEALPVEWDLGAGAAWKSHEAIYAAATATLDQPPAKVIRKAGVSTVTPSSTVEATYLTPYCDQAPLEPLNGTALVTKDRVELWHPYQDGQQSFWVVVDETGMDPQNVHLHQTLVGGQFGRRSYADDVRMVVAIARQYPDVPVKVIWSREEIVSR